MRLSITIETIISFIVRSTCIAGVGISVRISVTVRFPISLFRFDITRFIHGLAISLDLAFGYGARIIAAASSDQALSTAAPTGLAASKSRGETSDLASETVPSLEKVSTYARSVAPCKE